MSEKLLDPNVSAQFYLSKFQEYSENVLARESLGQDLDLDKTLRLIKEILVADVVILAERGAEKHQGILKAITSRESISTALDEKQDSILISLFGDFFTFDEDDEGAREAVGVLCDRIIPMSGFSVPIKSDNGLRGILAVCYELNVPATKSKILFLKSMANVLSHLQQSRELLSQVDIKLARHIINAKREWEGTVDSLEQLIIVLDENAKVIRANKAIQYWEVDGLDAVIGNHIEAVVRSLTGDDITNIFSNWSQIWDNLDKYRHIEWTSQVDEEKQILRFSLRKINNDSGKSKRQHQGYAVLFVEDITQSKEAEKELQNYATRLEGDLQKRNEQLEQVNDLLKVELEEQIKTRTALVKSEQKYHTLFNSSLSGICQLEEGRISFYNNRFAEIFKYPQDQLIGMPFIDLFSHDDQSDFLGLTTSESEATAINDVIITRTHDAFGKNLWLEIRLSHITLQKNKNVIVNVVDITRLKNIEISLRQSEVRLQKLSAQLINAQESERKRLALELHDSLGASLSAIKYSLEGFSKKIKSSDNNQHAGDVADIIFKIRDAIEETRNMAMDLRPSMLDDLGVLSTMNWFCRQFQETYKHIEIVKDFDIQESIIDNSYKIVIYRIIQEAMNNTVKHSSADRIHIFLGHTDEEFIHLSISDNGAGIKDLGMNPTFYKSIGLSGMRERVELTGGSFMVTQNDPHGVRINIRWPVHNQKLKSV